MWSQAVNQGVPLRHQEHPGGTGHGQVQVSCESPRRQVIEKNAFGPSLDGKSQCFPFASAERTLEHETRERLFQSFDVDPRGQRRNRGRDFGGHRGRDEDRLKDRGKKTQLPDSSERNQRAGIRNDGHSEGLAVLDFSA